MNKKLKAKWLKALRGGQYDQANSSLVSSDGTAFCCLGVLANEQGCVWTENVAGDFQFPVMPRGRKTFGINSRGNEAPFYLRPTKAGGLSIDDQKHLAKMNDDGKSFSEIADYIEASL